MEPDELRALISKIAALMESYQRHSDGTAQRQQAEIQAMQQLSRQVPEVIQQTTASSMDQLAGQIIGQVRAGLERSTSDYEQRLRGVGSEAASETQVLTREIVDLRRVLRLIIWKVVGIVMGTLLLLLAGGTWLSMHYVKVIEENQISADLLKAYNRADLMLCGNDQLCANVGGTKGPRYGDHRQYAPVMER